MEPKKVKRAIESVFSFDYLGDALGELRADADNPDLKQKLYEALCAAAKAKIGDRAEPELIETLCMERVEQFVVSAKASRGTGCGA
mgnify:CR=1 FL=1